MIVLWYIIWCEVYLNGQWVLLESMSLQILPIKWTLPLWVLNHIWRFVGMHYECQAWGLLGRKNSNVEEASRSTRFLNSTINCINSIIYHDSSSTSKDAKYVPKSFSNGFQERGKKKLILRCVLDCCTDRLESWLVGAWLMHDPWKVYSFHTLLFRNDIDQDQVLLQGHN